MGVLLEHLRRLEIDAEKAAKAATRKRREFADTAVNWGDFHCMEAAIVFPSTGISYYKVLFEEAHPGNPRVHEFISAYLKKRGWEGVKIEMEW